mgnify:CR=1 FL=1
MDKAELFARCEKIVTREELVKKLKGNPDFVPEEFYCKGAGQYCVEEDLCVQLVARAHLPTRFGEFTLFGFYDGREDKEHTAVVRGEVRKRKMCLFEYIPSVTQGTFWVHYGVIVGNNWKLPSNTSENESLVF